MRCECSAPLTGKPHARWCPAGVRLTERSQADLRYVLEYIIEHTRAEAATLKVPVSAAMLLGGILGAAGFEPEEVRELVDQLEPPT